MAEEIHCIQQQTIGELKSALQARKEESKEIKGRLDTMVTMLSSLHSENVNQTNNLRNELTKISTVLSSERELRQATEKEQDKQNTMIQDLRSDIARMSTSFDTLTVSLNNSVDTHKTIETRIRYLEKVSYMVWGIIIAIMAIGTVLTYIFSTMTGIKDLLESNTTTTQIVVQPKEIPPTSSEK